MGDRSAHTHIHTHITIGGKRIQILSNPFIGGKPIISTSSKQNVTFNTFSLPTEGEKNAVRIAGEVEKIMSNSEFVVMM